VQIREIMTGDAEVIHPDPTPPKTDEPAAQAQPEAVPAQSIDPDGQAGLSEPPFVGHRGAPESADDQAGAERQPSQELLSEIRRLAQKVGGWKQLSEIAEALEVDGGVCGS